MPVSFERIVFAVIALAAAALFGSTFSEEYDVPSFGGDVSTVFTPRIFLGLVFLLSLLLLITAKASGETEASGDKTLRIGAAELRRLLAVGAVCLAVALALPHAGFVAAAAPGMFLFCLFFGYRGWTTLTLTSVLGPFAVWYLFSRLLELPLPETDWISF